MTNALIDLAALGGAATFVSAVVVVTRGIFRQISATEDNTAALTRLTTTLQDHETRISRLEGSRM